MVAATCGALAGCGAGLAGAGMRAAGVARLACPVTVLWRCCCLMIKVVNTPLMATALARITSINLVDCGR